MITEEVSGHAWSLDRRRLSFALGRKTASSLFRPRRSALQDGGVFLFRTS
jgi:hypothetical protein